MRDKLNFLTGLLLFGFISVSKAQEKSDTIPWVIKNRSIPPPAAASEVLKKTIASMAQPDYDAVIQKVPKNDSGWKALQKSYDEKKKVLVSEIIRKMNVTVEQKKVNGVPVYYVSPQKVSDAFRHTIFFHIHGGAYIYNAGKAALAESAFDAAFLNILTISVDYRMPPDHPFPAALDDVIAAYKGLLKMYPAYKFVMGGTSAGGGLTMAAILKMKELKLKLPQAVFLGTPWSDLTKTGDSYYINEGIDDVLVTYDGILEAAAKLYANGHDLRDPYISPIYGDLSGFPPTFLTTGTRDLFLSNTVRSHRKLRDAGVQADLVVIEGISHGEYFVLPDSPESKSIFKDLSKFIKMHL